MNHLTSILVYAVAFNVVPSLCSDKPMERCSHINYLTQYNGCSQLNFCKKTFNISYINMPPYSPTNGMQAFLSICCKNCTKFHIVREFANISELTPETISTSDFIYPFLGSVNDKFMYGYYYIPVMPVPQAYYISRKQEISIFRCIFKSYPLIIICLLMAVVAGFLCWLAESRDNSAQFPRDFLVGWFEGFWWGFISMTTVGYGDKTPKTMIGRLFAVCWIIMGITGFAILTAVLTSYIVDANTHQPPSMSLAKVGILNHRQYDAFLVSHHGGLNVTARSPDFESSIYELAMKLHNRQIDGLLLDRYTLWSVISGYNFKVSDKINKSQREEVISVFKSTIHSSVEYKQEVLTFGILVKDEADLNFLHDVIKSNRFLLHTELSFTFNEDQKHMFHAFHTGLFDANHFYFQTAVLILMGTMLLICTYGALYEFARRKKDFKKEKIFQLNNSVEHEEKAGLV